MKIPTVKDWNIFLEKWNEAIFDSLDDETDLDNSPYGYEYEDALVNKCCLWQGASEEEISELEKILGVELPLSYRNFLFASNGFIILNRNCELYGTDRINWFIHENSDWVQVWNSNDETEVDDEQYFQYGDHQQCIWMRSRYLKTALQISSIIDGDVYLLNPQVKDSRNEWEAWDFGNKNPGAYRYRSFWEMMQKAYKKSCGP